MTVETEQASLERAWDVKEKENTLKAKQQRLDAICAGIISLPAAALSISVSTQDSNRSVRVAWRQIFSCICRY